MHLLNFLVPIGQTPLLCLKLPFTAFLELDLVLSEQKIGFERGQLYINFQGKLLFLKIPIRDGLCGLVLFCLVGSLDFLENGLYLKDVLIGFDQFALCFQALDFESRDSCRFFKDIPAIFRL
ncbi:hypothetical protein SDC9_84839 [bioreactor metagenome]|uniref:Uncharacterized protein n=1 Tax=bioreactor metagenome TaxID=1076179 RepID=A0A644ZBE4_9ZZZZ